MKDQKTLREEFAQFDKETQDNINDIVALVNCYTRLAGKLPEAAAIWLQEVYQVNAVMSQMKREDPVDSPE